MVSVGNSSFYAEPSPHLDPELFEGDRMRSGVRQELLAILCSFLDRRYANRPSWLHLWMAGSGASYRWGAGEGLQDLDMLLGIDFIEFRKANQKFLQVGDAEVATHINEELRRELWPLTSSWHDRYEVTWYVNRYSQDIRNLRPYAAYDLINDEWTVRPERMSPNVPKDWEEYARRMSEKAEVALQRYAKALTDLQNATNPPSRADALSRFHLSVDQAVHLYDFVHGERGTSFSPSGGGYADLGNYVWQTGKQEGWIPALREIKDYQAAAAEELQSQTYGMALPDADVLIRRAVTGGL